jgi:hypothetical protein
MNDSQSGGFCFLNESVALYFKNIPLKDALRILSERTQVKFSTVIILSTQRREYRCNRSRNRLMKWIE